VWSHAVSQLVDDRFKRTGKRDEIFLATKFGLSSDFTAKRAVNGDPEHVKECIETSLSRLCGALEHAAVEGIAC
jgi:aryl-alcohol dehydrogenase-like predicted oxidoreductase